MEWGRAESEARKADLRIGGAMGLAVAQVNAEERRRAIGASASAATRMVIEANRAARRAAVTADAGPEPFPLDSEREAVRDTSTVPAVQEGK